MTPKPNAALPRTIIEPGRNCWTVADVEASGLLIDGRDYYRAFYHAARQARSYVLIAGWRFNSDVRLLRGEDLDEAQGEVKFLPFLNQLCEANPELRIYVLAWDFSLIFAREWELFQKSKFEKAPHGRLAFHFDNQHPLGASHHQKFVVVDGRIGFVGGLDFNADDWDDRRHLAEHPDRHDSGEPPHEPYHDIQAYVVGAAAGELVSYFQVRWQAATGDKLVLPPPAPEAPALERPTLSLRADRVALARNSASTASDPAGTHQIRQLYLDAIDSADELIYIENQYFSSRAVCQALINRMRAEGRSRLEIVLVLPKCFPSWVEAATVGPPRLRCLDCLRAVAAETGHALGVYYTTANPDDGREVDIHSKLLIVDDRFLT
jgi:phosphatidylserine/phosphatidylglycerophosphate/cardiolipin synthase-like enzyme